MRFRIDSFKTSSVNCTVCRPTKHADKILVVIPHISFKKICLSVLTLVYCSQQVMFIRENIFQYTPTCTVMVTVFVSPD